MGAWIGSKPTGQELKLGVQKNTNTCEIGGAAGCATAIVATASTLSKTDVCFIATLLCRELSSHTCGRLSSICEKFVAVG
jgi:hypothetical protein